MSHSCRKWYSFYMTEEEALNSYIQLCQDIFSRMERENSWPWVTDPERWNENSPEHKVEISSDPLRGKGKSG